MPCAAHEIIACWKAGKEDGHPPREYADKLMKYFGKPDGYSPKKLYWYTLPNVGGIKYPEPAPLMIKVVDEYIVHDFPAKHHDFVYTKSKLPDGVKIEWEHAANLAYVTGSIIIDTLKQTVKARCGGLRANQITLGFVYDYVRGEIYRNRRYKEGKITKEVNDSNREALKREYKYRILNNVFPDDGQFANVFPDEIKGGTLSGGGNSRKRSKSPRKQRKPRKSRRRSRSKKKRTKK